MTDRLITKVRVLEGSFLGDGTFDLAYEVLESEPSPELRAIRRRLVEVFRDVAFLRERAEEEYREDLARTEEANAALDWERYLADPDCRRDAGLPPL